MIIIFTYSLIWFMYLAYYTFKLLLQLAQANPDEKESDKQKNEKKKMETYKKLLLKWYWINDITTDRFMSFFCLEFAFPFISYWLSFVAFFPLSYIFNLVFLFLNGWVAIPAYEVLLSPMNIG